MVFLAAWPLATTSTAVAAGLDITGSLLDVTMQPGTAYVHTMTIGNGFAYSLDLKVEARGLGQELDGSYVPLTSDNDQSPYSALTYIASIDKPSLHLEPGAAENVQVVVSAPAEAAAGTRYACVYINSQPAGTGQMGVVVAAIVPVVVTVPGSEPVKTADITGVTPAEVKSGQPIRISTVVKNMGTYHFKATNQVTIKDEGGGIFSENSTALTSSSIIPTFSRAFTASCTPADEEKGMPPGEYLVVSRVVLEDGTLLDVETTSLTVPEGYEPPAPEEEGESPEINWLIVAVAVLGALLAITIAALGMVVWRMRRQGGRQ